MKATLTFQIPEEQSDFEAAVNGQKYKDRLDGIWAHVFRPYFKHGYSGLHAAAITQLLEQEKCGILIELLAERYQELLRDDE